MSFFNDLFGDTAANAARQAGQTISQGYGQAGQKLQDYYGQGTQALQQGYGQAQNIFQPGYNIGQGGAQAYADIVGASGPEGQARARTMFQTDPGYEWQKQQALDATLRAQGTGGFQNSGNILTGLEDRASGLAAQQYGNYVNRLAPFLGYSLGTAGQLGGAFSGEGGALAQNYGQLGQGLASADIGSANAIASGEIGAANARTQAAGNIANLGARLLGFALSPAPTGGFANTNIANLFGGGRGTAPNLGGYDYSYGLG